MSAENDIIGTRPVRCQTAGLGLFDAASAQAAEAEIRRDFLQASDREEEADDGPDIPFGGLPSAEERREARERLKREYRAAIVALALGRVNQPVERPRSASGDLAGVTAIDARALMRRARDAALLGSAMRAWSWVGPWLAELARAGELVALTTPEGMPVLRRVPRETDERAHGNAQQVYVHPTDQRARAWRRPA